MKKIIRHSLAVFCFITGALTLMSNWNGPTTAASGSPAENGNTCANPYCHGGTPNTGGGNVSISAPSAYNAGKTYTIKVNVNDETSSKFGFQTVALDENNKNVGTFTRSSGTKLLKINNTNYIEHDGTDHSGSYSFEWTAPSMSAGKVTFYVAGNATNGNGQPTGDKIYTSTATSSFTTSIDQPESNGVEIYPSVASEKITLIIDSEQNFDISVLSVNGKLVFTQNDISKNFILPVSNFENGTYIIHLSANNYSTTEQFIVQH